MMMSTSSKAFVRLPNIVERRLRMPDVCIVRLRKAIVRYEHQHKNTNNMQTVVSFSNVSFAYSSRSKVLNSFSLNIPKGSIYGFLGPNGSGKSTTIRLLMGLLSPDAGEVSVLGRRHGSSRIAILSRIGSIIDTPTFYEHLTAAKNMEIVRVAHGLPKSSIEQALMLVGLNATAKLKVSEFSLGMKQRLALGMALMPNPELLVLDEPTNGLDPNGIIEIRELLIKINKERGTTIFVSSHLLAEVEKLCTHLTIINKGHQVFEGPIEKLTERIALQKKVWFTVNKADHLDVPSDKLLEIERNGSLKVGFEYVTNEEIAQFNSMLVGRGVEVYSINKEHQSLEEMYVKLVEESSLSN